MLLLEIPHLGDVGDQVLDHLVAARRRVHAVDADAVSAELERGDLRQPAHGELGGAVGARAAEGGAALGPCEAREDVESLAPSRDPALARAGLVSLPCPRFSASALGGRRPGEAAGSRGVSFFGKPLPRAGLGWSSKMTKKN